MSISHQPLAFSSLIEASSISFIRVPTLRPVSYSGSSSWALLTVSFLCLLTVKGGDKISYLIIPWGLLDLFRARILLCNPGEAGLDSLAKVTQG